MTVPPTELVHERMLELRDRQGKTYRRVLVYAERQSAGTWGAWVEFVSASGEAVVRTERETTQSTLNGCAYWATGLQRAYFEGALDRASRRTDPGAPSSAADAPAAGGGMVSFRIRSADPRAPFRVMGARTVLPGIRRSVQEEGADEGAFIYVRTVEPALIEMPRIYEFLAHFPSPNAAGVLAARLEADLGGTGATLEIRRVEVPIDSAAILTALLTAAAGGPDFTGRR
jgi:hypothetical protein